MANQPKFPPEPLYPLSFIRMVRGIPKLVFEEVEPNEVPDPYYSLLVHEGDMTSRLEAYYEDEVKVRKLSSSMMEKLIFEKWYLRQWRRKKLQNMEQLK